jgi:hypothetical protein
VISDYFGVQTWPSGGNWQCRWAYFASVVLYKPFTIPMWSCLTILSHYCFTALLYKGVPGSRDAKTGAPPGSPLPRNNVTIALLGVVSTLQLIWFIGVFPAVFPLMISFLPVVLLPSFILPLVVLGAAQFILSNVAYWISMCFKSHVLEAVKKDGSTLQKVYPWFRKDMDIVGTALRQDESQTKYMRRGTLMSAFDAKLTVSSLKYASNENQNDKEVVLKAVKCNGLEIKHVSSVLIRDFEVVLAAVSQNGLALQYAQTTSGFRYAENPKRLTKDEEEIMIAAVKQNKAAIDFTPSSWKGRSEFKETKQNNEAEAEESDVVDANAETKTIVLIEVCKPPPFGETVFTLKASATQLISVVVLTFLLLPLYDNGFAWWQHGAQQLVTVNFKFAFVLPQFSISFFSWPHFSRPTVQFQFAIGLMVIAMKYLIKIGKWFLFTYSRNISIPNSEMSLFEASMVKTFSLVSWQFFRRPMEAMQLTSEKVLQDARHHATSGKYVEAVKIMATYLPLVSFNLIFSSDGYTKRMPFESGDNEILSFIQSEASMSVCDLELSGKGTTLDCLRNIKLACPWIAITKLKLSIRTSGLCVYD